MSKIFLGKNAMGNKVFYEENKDLIVEAATRLGFGTCIAIPTLIESKENIIVFDIQENFYTLTKKYRESIGYKTLKIDNNTTDLEIEKILSEEKFTIYIGVNLKNFCEKSISSFYTKALRKILGSIKEKKINCLTIVNEFPLIFSAHPYLLEYRCINNQFLLRIQTMEQLKKINSIDKSLKIEDFSIIKFDFQTNSIIFGEETYEKNYWFKDLKYKKLLLEE